MGVAPPQELGDRPAHRVPDGHELFHLQCPGYRRRVVGVLFQSHPSVLPEAEAAMAPMVKGDDPGPLGHRAVGPTPVHVGRDRRSVEEQHDRSARRASRITYLEGSATGKVDGAPLRSLVEFGGRLSLDHHVGCCRLSPDGHHLDHQVATGSLKGDPVADRGT